MMEHSMRILVTGATGRVGREVVGQALVRGHEVIAFSRSADKLAIQDARLRKVAGDIRKAGTVVPLLENLDAVIHAVGIGPSKVLTTIYSQGARSIIAGMLQYGVPRLVAISSQAANVWANQPLYGKLILLPILQHLFGATYDDMRRMERVLWESSVNWTQVRSPYISGKAPKGSYRFSNVAVLPRYRSITVADMATALLDIAARDDLSRQDVFVAN
jgi:putative NADH-flavin reductase